MPATPPSAPAVDSNPSLSHMQALDDALREVIAAARVQVTQATPEMPEIEEQTGDLNETVEIVLRAAKTIDHLVERNRAVTDAAVRSVEFLRKESTDARSEADQLRAEMQALRAETESIKAAAIARVEELETELAIKDQELATAHDWIENIRSHIETLLGNADTRLDEATPRHMFSRD